MSLVLPNFIGIGAPKSGTTWLARCLAEHPDIFVAKAKEIDFWKYPDAEDRLKTYSEHFESGKRSKQIGEFTVRYLYFPRVAERIRSVLPDVKLIVSLRNPTEQVPSFFWHLQRQGFNLPPGEAVPNSIAEALENESHREFLLSPARYASHLSNFYSFFPRDQIHLIRFDDIKLDAKGVLEDLFRFLNVDPSFVPPSLNERGSSVRRGVSPKNAVAAVTHKKIYHCLVRGMYNPLKRLIGVRRAAAIKDSLRIRQVMERLFFRSGYSQPSKEEVAAIRSEFSEELARLEELTEWDLTSWRAPSED